MIDGPRSLSLSNLVVGLLPPAVLFTVLLVGGYVGGPTLDAAVFMQIAEQVRAGDIPYRDVFDHKPPGIFLAEAAFGVAVPWLDPWVRAWSITLFAGVTTIAIVQRVIAAELGVRIATLATFGITPILAGYPFAVGGGHTESLAVLPVTLGMAIAISREPGARGAVAVGMLLAAGIATSIQVSAGAIAAAMVLQARWRSPKATLGMMVGGAIIAAPIITWLVASGAAGPAFDQLVVYNAAYAAQNRGLLAAAPLLLLLAAMTAAPALLTGLVGVLQVRRPKDRGWLGAAAGAWIAAWVVYLLVQGRLVGHHVIAVAPAIAMLSALAFARLGVATSDRRSTAQASAAIMGAVATFALAGFAIPGQPQRPSQLDLAGPIVRSAVDGTGASTLFVWGNEPSIYLETGLRPASRFVYMLPLHLPGYASAEHIQFLLKEWRVRPPGVIVDAGQNPEGVNGPILTEFGVPARRDDGLDPLRAFVGARYVAYGSAGGWTIYTLGSGS